MTNIPERTLKVGVTRGQRKAEPDGRLTLHGQWLVEWGFEVGCNVNLHRLLNPPSIPVHECLLINTRMPLCKAMSYVSLGLAMRRVSNKNVQGVPHLEFDGGAVRLAGLKPGGHALLQWVGPGVARLLPAIVQIVIDGEAHDHR